MKSKNLLAAVTIALVALAVAAAGSLAAPRQPMTLATVGDSYAAPYDAVWDATLRSLGVVKTPVADKASGRIETEPFVFTFNIGSGLNGGTQVIEVSFLINVFRTAENKTDLQVVPRIHYSWLNGFAPGPYNNPWLDLFAKIRTRLGARS